MREDGGQRVGDGGHGLDEDVQRDADDVFAGVADGVAGNGSLMRRRALSMSIQEAAFDVLLGVVESAAGVAHEDSTRNRYDRSAD